MAWLNFLLRHSIQYSDGEGDDLSPMHSEVLERGELPGYSIGHSKITRTEVFHRENKEPTMPPLLPLRDFHYPLAVVAGDDPSVVFALVLVHHEVRLLDVLVHV